MGLLIACVTSLITKGWDWIFHLKGDFTEQRSRAGAGCLHRGLWSGIKSALTAFSKFQKSG